MFIVHVNVFVFSLTLNKLRQKRMLEEKLQQKRSRQLHKLQEKHEQEAQVSTCAPESTSMLLSTWAL